MYSEKCRSWYKLGKDEGRIVGLWPGNGSHIFVCGERKLTIVNQGSSLHAQRALSSPRWEDYNYEQSDEGQDGLYWLGDGQTYNEKTLTGDRTFPLSIHVAQANFTSLGAWYLAEEFVDRPPSKFITLVCCFCQPNGYISVPSV